MIAVLKSLSDFTRTVYTAVCNTNINYETTKKSFVFPTKGIDIIVFVNIILIILMSAPNQRRSWINFAITSFCKVFSTCELAS